ncbi:MAG TPA: PilZ domain-containing protein [Haliangium sp.]|nr:PilZ domain-containing protein [Haliangium sp.]
MAHAVHAFEHLTDQTMTVREVHDRYDVQDQAPTMPIVPSVNVHLRVTVIPRSGAEPVEGELVNIGADSMFVRAPIKVSPGKMVHLRFRMLAKRVCEARGQVVWQQDGGFGVVIEERNPAMDSFLREAAKLTPNLRQIYLADVLYPRIDVAL